MARKKRMTNLWNKAAVSLISIASIFGLVWTAFWWSGYRDSLAISQVRFGNTSVLNTQIYQATLGEIVGQDSPAYIIPIKHKLIRKAFKMLGTNFITVLYYICELN